MSVRKDTDELIAFLNSVASIDPSAMGRLIALRVPCNSAMAGHPSIQVAGHGDGDDERTIPAGEFRVGVLGLLNGYAGTIDEGRLKGWGPISAMVEDDGTVSGFLRTGTHFGPS